MLAYCVLCHMLALRDASCPKGKNDFPHQGRRFLCSIFCSNLMLILPSFWTSRGHGCRSLSPPIRAFIFYRAKGSAFPTIVDFSSRFPYARPSRASRVASFAQEKVTTSTSAHSETPARGDEGTLVINPNAATRKSGYHTEVGVF